MIYHASIPTNRPERVARVLAELWGGKAFPFPPCPGAFIAMAGDDRGSAIECYPQLTVVEPGDDAEAARFAWEPRFTPLSAFHLAVATPLSETRVHAIAQREGWRAVRCSRGGVFDVIEIWLENVTMIEVLTVEMQAQYLASFTTESWAAMLAGAEPEPLRLAA